MFDVKDQGTQGTSPNGILPHPLHPIDEESSPKKNMIEKKSIPVGIEGLLGVSFTSEYFWSSQRIVIRVGKSWLFANTVN